MSINTRCTYCRKTFKSTAALSRHGGLCNVKHGRTRPRILKALDPDYPTQRLIDSTLDWNSQQTHSHPALTTSNLEDTLIPTTIPSPTLDDGYTEPQFSDDEHVPAENSVTSSIQRGRRTETHVSKSLKYSDWESKNIPNGGERAGRPAGQPLLSTPGELSAQTLEDQLEYEHQPLKNALRRKRDSQAQEHKFNGIQRNEYLPFRSSYEWRIVNWFLKYKLPKTALNDFLRDKSLNPASGHVSFRNCEQMFDLVDKIEYGIKDDQWRTQDLHIAHDEQDKSRMTYVVKYRRVLPVIEFLLSFPPFAPYLHYTPERHFDDWGDRIYHEMYTGEWWWDVQHQLDDPFATIVPLLISSDKTLLTNHHGDQSAWVVYLTIGNLDRSVRMKHSLPSLVPIAFLPILKNTRERPGLAHEVYHKSMEIVFDGKLQ